MFKKLKYILPIFIFTILMFTPTITSKAYHNYNDEWYAFHSANGYGSRGPRCWCKLDGSRKTDSGVMCWFGYYDLCDQHGVSENDLLSDKDVEFTTDIKDPTCTQPGKKHKYKGIEKNTSVSFFCHKCSDSCNACLNGSAHIGHSISHWSEYGGWRNVPQGSTTLSTRRISRDLGEQPGDPALGHSYTGSGWVDLGTQHYRNCTNTVHDISVDGQKETYEVHDTLLNPEHYENDYKRHWDCAACNHDDTKWEWNIINHVFNVNMTGSTLTINNQTTASYTTRVDNVEGFYSPTPKSVTGYTFRGWLRRGQQSSPIPQLGYTGNVTVSSNVSRTGRAWDFDNYSQAHNNGTYYLDGVWKRNSYYVAYATGTSQFASNCPDKSITGDTAKLTCEYDISYNHKKALTNKWYYFAGWKLGTNTPVTAESSFKNLTSTSGATVTETAQWKPKTFNIKYNTNRSDATGATSTVNNVSVESGVTIWTPTTAYSKGWYIDHWNTKSDDTGKSYTFGQSTGAFWYAPSSNTGSTLNLYAIWKPYTYTVTYTAGSGEGSDVVETLTYQGNRNLFNNTPNLEATKVTGSGHNSVAEPHFTKEGYYIDYWVPSYPTSVYESGSNVTANQNTGTGYNGDKIVSTTTELPDLLIPGNNTHSHVVTESKGFNQNVILTAHWAPIQYKVTYYNDSTVPGSHGSPYDISSNTFVSDAQSYAETYQIPVVNFTRKNKYGSSTFLGYCYYEGCITKDPTFAVIGQSPESYLTGRATSIGEGSFAPNVSGHDSHSNDATTVEGTTWKNYFKYLDGTSIQSFKLYAVWDDCPGLEPVDVEQQKDVSEEQYNRRTNGIGSKTLSGRDLEYYILHLSSNEDSLWDREDDVSYLIQSKDNYYLKNFDHLGIKSSDNVSSYKITFVIKDSYGHIYEASRKLYAGKYHDIMLHENVTEFSQ